MPQNATLFENRVITDVVTRNEVVRWALIHSD